MGSRGVYSAGHKFENEKRKDIIELFVNRIGFSKMYDTKDIGTAQLSVMAQELQKLDHKYKVIQNNDVWLTTTYNCDVFGVAGKRFLGGDGEFIMKLNPSKLNDVKKASETVKYNVKIKYVTSTKDKLNALYSYTVRHEYGHLLQYAISKKTGKSALTIQKELIKMNGGKSKSPSTYGKKNEWEFFAESFANMTGGKPTSSGKTLEKWLKKNGF